MKHQVHCTDASRILRYKKFCIDEISKDTKGYVRQVEQEIQPCEHQDCKTLKTRHVLKLDMRSHDPCDSERGRLLNGTLASRNLVHAFKDGSFMRRGVHAADFQWFGSEVYAVGTLSGITNAGTHPDPVFKKCQPCDALGYMEGRFCGAVVEAEDPHHVGCQILGTYRLQTDVSDNGFGDSIAGTLEGVMMCDCRPGTPGGECIDFTTFAQGAGPNPRIEQGVEFLVRDFMGNMAIHSEIWQLGSHTGLNTNYTTEISLPVVASSVSVTLVHFAVPAKVSAFNADSSLAGSAVMSLPQGQAETLQFSGPAINRVVIDAPQNEVAMLELCYERVEG